MSELTDKETELLEETEVTGRVDLTKIHSPLEMEDPPGFHFMWLSERSLQLYQAIPEFKSLEAVGKKSPKEVKEACQLGTKSDKTYGDLILFTVTEADYKRHLAAEDAKRAKRQNMIVPASIPGTRTTTKLEVSRNGITQERYKQET